MSIHKRPRDAPDRPLSDYPHPSVAVDTAVLTVPIVGDLTPGGTAAPAAGLQVLLVRRLVPAGEEWLLPGTFLHEGERLSDAVLRSLRDKAGIDGLSPSQLRVFDDPSRDDRGWVLSVAHVDAVPWQRIADAVRPGGPSQVQMRPVAEAVRLPFDHDAIVAHAVASLRSEYLEHPDPAALLPEPFTLRRLQHLHEAVLGSTVAKDSFRRRMEPHLEPIGSMSTGHVGKPARLFARAGRTRDE